MRSERALLAVLTAALAAGDLRAQDAAPPLPGLHAFLELAAQLTAPAPGAPLPESVPATQPAEPAEPAEPDDCRGKTTRPRALARAAQPQGELPSARPCALLMKDSSALKALYSQSAPGPIPDGDSHGRATLSPGTPFDALWQHVLGLAWQGKIFHRIDDQHGELTNKVPVGKVASAKVYYGPSLVDGKPSIILDYKHSDVLAARGIRDEIRMVGPNLYLGFAYVYLPLQRRYALWLPFALDFTRP